MSNREDYINDGSGLVRVDPDHSKVIPEYLMREAEKEESWEVKVKRDLEISSWARELNSKFLQAFKTENRQMIRVWEPEKAAAWLKEKVLTDGVFDHAKANEILVAAQADEEKRTDVIALLGEADEKEEKPVSGSPTQSLKEINTPATVNEVLLEAEEAKLKMRKAVGSYGLILTEASCQVYSKGVKLAELSTEDCGGYPVLAAEVEAMETDLDVVAFFGLGDDLEEIESQGWGLKSTAAPIVDGPALQRVDQQPAPTMAPAVPGFDPATLPPAGRPGLQTPGPASLTPGAPVENAPTIPGQIK